MVEVLVVVMECMTKQQTAPTTTTNNDPGQSARKHTITTTPLLAYNSIDRREDVNTSALCTTGMGDVTYE
jgi:hypothetical protein